MLHTSRIPCILSLQSLVGDSLSNDLDLTVAQPFRRREASLLCVNRLARGVFRYTKTYQEMV